ARRPPATRARVVTPLSPPPSPQVGAACRLPPGVATPRLFWESLPPWRRAPPQAPPARAHRPHARPRRRQPLPPNDSPLPSPRPPSTASARAATHLGPRLPQRLSL